MLFHAFRVVYTGKELDSHAKHRQSFKKMFWTYNRVFLCQKSHFRVRTSFGEFFSIVVLDDINDGGTPYMGISPGRTRPYTHRPERERERAHQHASIGRLAARDSLGKNVSKEVCFWLWGKDNLVQLPKRTHRYVNRGYSLFFWGSNGVSQVFCWRTFYKQGPVRRWICTSFNTERWSGPSYKRSRSWFRTADGKWNGIKCLCFVGDRSKCSSLFSSATRHASRSSAFFGENRKSVSFFYKYDKTKDFFGDMKDAVLLYRYSRLTWDWVKLCALGPL